MILSPAIEPATKGNPQMFNEFSTEQLIEALRHVASTAQRTLIVDELVARSVVIS
jgi:hypothetical protein